MTSIQVIILSIIQGITEFFPISSSGHLVIMESFFNLPVDKMMSFDIAVHFGSLLAILVYFYEDFKTLINLSYNLFYDVYHGSVRKIKNNEVLFLLIGTIPAVIFGLLLKPYFEEYFRNSKSVALMMIVVGSYFILAEVINTKRHKNTLLRSLFIGLSQAVAILPGVSRSGSTIATGMLCGLKREESARFSFLLGSIAILGASILTGLDILNNGLDISFKHLILGIMVSFVVSFLSINILMAILKKYSLKGFAVYLIILGVLVILFI